MGGWGHGAKSCDRKKCGLLLNEARFYSEKSLPAFNQSIHIAVRSNQLFHPNFRFSKKFSWVDVFLVLNHVHVYYVNTYMTFLFSYVIESKIYMHSDT